MPIIGAIIGDIAGSVYEWNNIKTRPSELFCDGCHFTDDTVLTIAIARGLMDILPELGLDKTEYTVRDEIDIKLSLIKRVREYCMMYPDAGYGGMFRKWLETSSALPYHSFGNGSAMRVSFVSWIACDLAHAEKLAEITASITHDHPDGIAGAKAVAAAIYLARTGASRDEILNYISEHFYKIDFTLDEIRPLYTFDATCHGSVPQAIRAFYESKSFEDAIALAISIGGDSDTIAAITGSIAETYYGVEDALKNRILNKLPEALRLAYTEIEKDYKRIYAQK